MRQVFITRTGGPEVLELREAPDPLPTSGAVRIRVKAAGVNFADIMARKGLYPDAPKLPAVVGYEVSGVVDAVGPETSEDWLDKEVVALTRFGGYADTVVAPVEQVFAKPARLTHAECAAIPVNYLTAWQLMVVMGALAEGETVLIHNAGGGVGLAAIDIGKRRGARLIGTASAGKHEFLKSRGLDAAIDYTQTDWLPEVMRLTEGRGVELILDPLGGGHWRKSYKALRATGRLGMFGASDAAASPPSLASESSFGRREHAVVPPAIADERQQGCVRREPRPSVGGRRQGARLGRHAVRRRSGRVGSPACRPDIPARRGRRGARLYRGAAQQGESGA